MLKPFTCLMQAPKLRNFPLLTHVLTVMCSQTHTHTHTHSVDVANSQCSYFHTKKLDYAWLFIIIIRRNPNKPKPLWLLQSLRAEAASFSLLSFFLFFPLLFFKHIFSTVTFMLQCLQIKAVYSTQQLQRERKLKLR